EDEMIWGFVRIVDADIRNEYPYDPKSVPIPRKEFYEQKTRFCVCCIDGGARCSARAAEAIGVPHSTSAGSSAREPDYCKRKRVLLVCEQRGGGRSAENARRKLFFQTDTGRSHVWPDRRSRGRRFVYVLLASHW